MFDFSLRGLVATSGVLAVILGLAIQSSLNDVFSGIVLNATAPCAIGDWIKIDTTEGKVIDINWRATHLITLQGNIVIIPNSVIAKAKIINNNRPAKLHGISILIEVSVSERPETVLIALNNALMGMSILLKDPKPSTMVKTVSMNSVQYEVAAFVDEVGKKRVATNTLYDLCYRHLAAAGVEIKPLGININHQADVFDRKKKLLSFVRLFQLLNHQEIMFLSNNMTAHLYEPGDVILSPDAVADYLLIIASGVVAVESITSNNQTGGVRLSPGDSLGGASVIAGIPISLTAKVLIPTVVYHLDKQIIGTLITEYKDAGEKLCQMLSQSEPLFNVLDTVAPDLVEGKKSIFERLLYGMHNFHKLQ